MPKLRIKRDRRQSKRYDFVGIAAALAGFVKDDSFEIRPGARPRSAVSIRHGPLACTSANFMVVFFEPSGFRSPARAFQIRRGGHAVARWRLHFAHTGSGESFCASCRLE